MMVIVYDRWGNVVYKARNKSDLFLQIPCQECGGTGIWDYYPKGYIPKPKDLICSDCKGTGIRYVDLY